MPKVLILGAGGFAREVLDIYYARDGRDTEVVGFLDDDPARRGEDLNGRPVLGGLDWLEGRAPGEFECVCGVGAPATRRKLVRKAAARGLAFANVVHPSAILTPFVELGRGVVITAGSILTNRIRLGDHVHVNLGCTIGHDDAIGDYVTLAPGVHVSGNVTIGAGCDIGTGAVILQGLAVGSGSIVGAGAVVTADIPPDSTAVGVPARVIKTRSPGWREG